MAEPERTQGHCGQCRDYGWGRFAEVISEYADAITDHEGCPAGQPPTVVQPRRSHRSEAGTLARSRRR